MRLKWLAWMVLVLAGCGASQSRSDHIVENEGRSGNSIEEILRSTYRTDLYSLEDPEDFLVSIVVGNAVFPFGRKLTSGVLNKDLLSELMSKDSQSIQCLCMPDWTRLMVLYDQWGSVCGALAYAPNHNSITVYDAGGIVVIDYRFQRMIPNKDDLLLQSSENTVQLDALVPHLVQ